MKNPEDDRYSLRRWELLAFMSVALIILTPLLVWYKASTQKPVAELATNQFVGSEKCKKCHESVYEKWRGSHHDQAMAVADESTVLGDFNDQLFIDPHNGNESRFYRKNGKYFVETEGPDGKRGEFQISHTFGVEPLQQYLVPFPNGRLQCLNIAWDVVQKRWYRLPPYEVQGSDDWLHWTKGGQTWNAMCAECHSTRLEKNYNLESDEYKTSWYEINVGCEACHGPSGAHVTWADRPAMARQKIPNYGLVMVTNDMQPQQQADSCAPCHSRRFQVGDNNHSSNELLDVMVPQLLNEGLYYPDGQILDEVYVYGSFVQSKMYHSGVRCSDCHDVHSLKLHKTENNDLCLQCHRDEDYDTPKHHFHKKVHEGKPSNGYLCVKCHMPESVYMGIDARADHSIRIPRPDLSLSLGTPNACSTTECHPDKSPEWISGKFDEWYGITRKSHYGVVFAAARSGNPGAEAGLILLADDPLIPVIVRATAVSLLAQYPSRASLDAIARALEADDALLRYTAIRNLEYFDIDTRLQKIAPKLYDPAKAVRAEAAYMLSILSTDRLREDDREAFQRGMVEYKTMITYMADFQTGRFNLGNLAAREGDVVEAILHYRKAIEIDDHFYPAKVNLATLYNQQGKNAEAERLLREALQEQTGNAEVNYSLALLLAEEAKFIEAEEFMARAVELMPGYGRAHFNHGLILQKLNRPDDVAKAFQLALAADQANIDYFNALANHYIGQQQLQELWALMMMVLERDPNHAGGRELMQYFDTR